MLKTILPLANLVVVTKSHNPRACEPSSLKEMIYKLDSEIKVVVKDQIKAYLKRKFSQKKPKIEIDALPQPDGKYLLVVREEEG